MTYNVTDGDKQCVLNTKACEGKNRLVSHARRAASCLSVLRIAVCRWRSFVRKANRLFPGHALVSLSPEIHRVFLNAVILAHHLSIIRFLADLG